MNPLNFPGVNRNYTAPKGMDNCGTLPVHVDQGVCHSVWEPTEDERRRIAAGENVVLSIWGHQPPVAVTVASIQGEIALRLTV